MYRANENAGRRSSTVSPMVASNWRSRSAAGRPSSSSTIRPWAAVTTVRSSVGMRWEEVTAWNGRSVWITTITPASLMTSPLTQMYARRPSPFSVAAHPPTNRICGAAAAEPMQNASSWPQVPSSKVIPRWRVGSSALAEVPSAAAARLTASRLRVSGDFGRSGATPRPIAKRSV